MGKVVTKFHAMQLFTDTFIAETVHLTNNQLGIYTRLLNFHWTKNARPFSTEDAYIICQCKDDECRDMVDKILREFFIMGADKNTWTNKRVLSEHQYLTDKYKKKSEAGQKGARIRHSAYGKSLTPIPNPNPKPNNKYTYNIGFEKLWNLLKIKRGSKFKAHEVFNKVWEYCDKGIDDVAEIYNNQTKDIENKFVPHFSTWLSQRRWENDEKQEESITIVQKMEKLGYVFRHTEANFDYFKKDGIEYKIDRYDKDHIIHRVE
jgi:uncharacterized protein YdaU (DUF1376 family)